MYGIYLYIYLHVYIIYMYTYMFVNIYTHTYISIHREPTYATLSLTSLNFHLPSRVKKETLSYKVEP